VRFLLAIALLQPLIAQVPTCSIEGRVTNLLSGGPVRKAKLVLGIKGNPKYEAVTDTNGHYAITGIAPGRYQLALQRTGFLPTNYGAHGPNRPGKSLLLSAGESRKDVNFLLEPPAVITGHIYDQDGEVLSTSLQLFREVWRDGRKHIEVAGGANSDDEGEYRLYGLPAGNYIVGTVQSPVRPASPVPTHEIYPPTFYPGTEDATSATVIRIAPGGEARNIDIRVHKTASVSLSGSIVTAALDPAMSLKITRRDGAPTQLQGMYPQQGEFSVRGVTPGSYIVNARTQTDYARVNIDAGTLDVSGIEVRLVPLLQLKGSLVEIDAEAPDLTLTLTSADPNEPPANARPDEKGAILWSGLTPGKWTLSFVSKASGLYLKSPGEIEIGLDGHEPIKVVVSSNGASIEGTVQSSAGHPVAVEAATVLLVSDGEKNVRVLKHAITDPDGKFAMASIPPGKYRLVALEDIETSSWDNPAVAQTLEGRGLAIELAPSDKAMRTLFLTQP
jgi:protocatechuate 3,4-dioxygenase beta subunit